MSVVCRRKLAVKELIERYYYQLTDGCGRQNCPNQHCASNGRLGPLSPNDAAARALQLVVAKAELCVGTAKLSADLHNRQAPCECILHVAFWCQYVAWGPISVKTRARVFLVSDWT